LFRQYLSKYFSARKEILNRSHIEPAQIGPAVVAGVELAGQERILLPTGGDDGSPCLGRDRGTDPIASLGVAAPGSAPAEDAPYFDPISLAGRTESPRFTGKRQQSERLIAGLMTKSSIEAAARALRYH